MMVKIFFFSLASSKVVNKSNTNILKRKIAIKALKQFKEFYIKKVIKSDDNKMQDKITIKNMLLFELFYFIWIKHICHSTIKIS